MTEASMSTNAVSVSLTFDGNCAITRQEISFPVNALVDHHPIEDLIMHTFDSSAETITLQMQSWDGPDPPEGSYVAILY